MPQSEHNLMVTRYDGHLKTMKRSDNALFFIPPEFICVRPSSPPIVRDICKDGGLIKKILEKGEEWEHPNDHDDVLVRYEVRLDDGTLVAKSDGVEFTLEDGHFCPALSMAVKTMKKEEKAILTVKPQYGFGEKGKPAHSDEGSVPPNASLQITLELVSWKILTLRKKVVKEGEGYECPNEGATVKLKLIGKLQDGTIFVKKGHSDDEDTLFEFKTDEDKVIYGLDRAVMTMKKGEIALLTIAPEYAFDDSECQQELAVVPPNSTLYYEVELVSFVQDKESLELNNEEKIDMSNKEKIEAASKMGEEAHALFLARKYARASKRYEMAVKLIEDDASLIDEEKIEARLLKRSCNMTNALCKLSLKDDEQADILFTKAEEPTGAEVWTPYRRPGKRAAKKYIHLHDSDFGVSDLDNRGASVYLIMFNKIKNLIGFL